MAHCPTPQNFKEKVLCQASMNWKNLLRDDYSSWKEYSCPYLYRIVAHLPAIEGQGDGVLPLYGRYRTLCEGNQPEVGGWCLPPRAQRLAHTTGHKADEGRDS